MRIKKARTYFIAVFLIIAIINLICGVQFFARAEGNGNYKLELSENIEASYFVGDKFTVPTGVFTDGNSEVAAECVLTYPSENVKAEKEVEFSVAGNYTLTYTATVGDQILNEEKNFTVYGKKYAADYINASADFEKAREFRTSKDGTQTIEVAGIDVTLAEGAVFEYNEVFDLTGKTKNDVVFSANIVPAKTNDTDFWELTVRFTDIYDEYNYVDVTIMHSGSSSNALDMVNDGTNYVRAGSATQKQTATRYGDITQMDGWGTWTSTSFAQRDDIADLSANTFDISFDYEEKQIFTFPRRKAGEGAVMITDLDEPSIYSEFWKGFTTGECKVSVFAEAFQKTSGKIFVRSIFEDSGADFEELKLFDRKEPIIQAELGEYTETSVPNALVDRAYKIFDVNAFDYAGGLKYCISKVYFNYHSTNKTDVTVIDGAFIPKYEGTYTIKYIAEDYFGNISTKTIDVICNAATEALSVELENGEKNFDTGDVVTVPAYTIKNASGVAEITIVAVCGEQRYEIDLQKMSFVPMFDGKYTIEYNVKDYIGQKANATFVVNVTSANAPKFMQEPVFPDYFVQGYAQTLPIVEAYDFKDGAKKITPEIWVKEGNEEAFKLNGSKYVPTIATLDFDVLVVYKAVGKYGTNEIEKTISALSIVKDASKQTVESNIDKTKLFKTDDTVSSSLGTISALDQTQYAIYSASEDGGINYINRLPANETTVCLNVLQNGFEKINIIFTDSANKQVQVKATLTKANSSSVYLSINDGILFPVSNLSFDNAGKEMQLALNATKKTIAVDYGASSFSITNNLQGNVFNGFSSGKVYMRIEMEDVSSLAQIAVKSVCNQRLIASGRDTTDPVFSIAGEYAGYYKIGSVATIFTAVCVDMIAPETPVKMTCYDPNKNVVTALDGTLLSNVDIEKEYKIKLASYGRYYITYEIEGYTPIDYILNVVDLELPEIRVQTEFKETYAVGDKLDLRATVTDNCSTNLTVFVCVTDSLGRTRLCTDGKYTLTREGKYTVSFFAYDDYGNYGVETVAFYVEG